MPTILAVSFDDKQVAPENLTIVRTFSINGKEGARVVLAQNDEDDHALWSVDSASAEATFVGVLTEKAYKHARRARVIGLSREDFECLVVSMAKTDRVISGRKSESEDCGAVCKNRKEATVYGSSFELGT